MKSLIENSIKAKRLLGSVKWSTIWRKDRERRKESYRNIASGYQQMVNSMWERVGPPNTDLDQDPEPSNLKDVRAKCRCIEATGSRGVVILELSQHLRPDIT